MTTNASNIVDLNDSWDQENPMGPSMPQGDVSPTLSRTPPHNLEAEQALLGALLTNNGAYEKVSDFLRPEHFADAVHGRIYAAMGRLMERGHVADPITLKAFFQQDEALAAVGGAEYLVQLSLSVISIINVQDYGRTIHDLYLRRQLIDIGSDVVNDAHQFDMEITALNQIETTEQKLFDLATIGQTDRGFQTFGSALGDAIQQANSAYKRSSKVIGVTTGLVDLDNYLGGLHPSDLLILAGRPSMGKTALATNIAFNAAKALLKGTPNGGNVAFFSLEMSAEQLAGRLLAQETSIPSHSIRTGELKEEHFQTFVSVSRELESLSLHIDDTAAISVSALRTRCRRLKRQKGLDLVVIDYLQLLMPSTHKRSENRVQEISDITRSLKALAKELHVPVIALSQLSRAVEQREDKRPQLSDLRESGSIEQDADVVMFVYREEYYESRKTPPEKPEDQAQWLRKLEEIHNVAEVIIAKQRHGPIGTVKLFFEGSLTKFGNLDPHHRG